MSCAACVARIERALAAVKGVRSASVSLTTGRATITIAPDTDVRSVMAAVADAGYAIRPSTTEFAVRGMMCASCVGHVESALRALPGVISATVNLATERATVVHATGLLEAEAVVAAIAAAGYEARLIPPDPSAETANDRHDEAATTLSKEARRAGLLTLPIVAIEMGGHLVPAFHQFLETRLGAPLIGLVLFALTTLVLFGPGRQFYARGIPSLMRGTPDMNALVAIGTLAAWGYSSVATFAPSLLPAGQAHAYFESAAVIVTLVLAGRALEAASRGRASAAIRRLAGLQPATAEIIRDGRAVAVPIATVHVGDLVQVKPGERVPVDGIVSEGATFIDEAMITGEPIPVAKTIGAQVLAGTVNTTGSFTLTATKVGRDTVLANIVRMVEGAQAAKLPIQAKVDQVTSYFVPIVLGIALATFLAWLVFGPSLALALVASVAVLIIACPCAMGLATPTSILVATGRAAELGILFRRGDALEQLGKVRTIVLDKTGTLTLGRPTLSDVHTAPGFARDEVLRLAAGLEARSEHPLARAIVAGATNAGLTLPAAGDVQTEPGGGIAGMVEGRRIAVGAPDFLADRCVAIALFDGVRDAVARAGKTPVFVAIDGRAAAVLAMADTMRPSTPAAVDALRRQGLSVVIATGDDRAAAEAVASNLGISDVHAGMLPAGKQDLVRRLRARGPVAFVGDGINDAPALAAADVGIAIGGGTDIAIESAEVVLMSADLRGVVNAIALSRHTMRNIAENLGWAFGYNALLIPVAAGVLYPAYGLMLSPMLAALAMGLSSVFVVLNALRLRRVTPLLPVAR